MTQVKRVRSARAVANDIAIRDAAINIIVTGGIDRLSLRDVGQRAGLTHGATYARFEDVDELLVDIWNSLLSHRAVAMLELSLRAASEPTAESVGTLFNFIRDAGPADVASVHALLVARRIPTLHEEVEPFIQRYLEHEIANPVRSRALVVFGFLIVHVFGDHRFERDDDYLSVLEKLILATLQTSTTEVDPVEPRAFDERILDGPTENLKSRLAFATLGVVGRSGYHRATITRIARRAACSPGAIYKMYPSKEDLVIAAFRDVMRARWLRISHFLDILEEKSIAQLMYASASKENEFRRNFTMETGLAAMHSDKIRLAITSQLRELEDAVPPLVNVADSEVESLRYFIRYVTNLTVGASWLAIISPRALDIDFNQFSEPFRRVVLRDGLPNWPDISAQIRSAVVH